MPTFRSTTSTLRRTRRQLALISVLFILVFCGNYIRNILSGDYTTNITFKTFIEPVTVFRTETTWAQAPSKSVPSEQHYPQVHWDDKVSMEEHRYKPNGLLEVNPEAQHRYLTWLRRVRLLGRKSWVRPVTICVRLSSNMRGDMADHLQ